ncbi:transposition protein, TnsD-related protein [Alicycliphilus sp. B1]|nr:transposition protein, TnsD-related protein [Alicycliphilus sp. B1]
MTANLRPAAERDRRAALAILVPAEPSEAFRSLIDRTSALNQSTRSEISRRVFLRTWSQVDWGVPAGVSEFAAQAGELLGLGDPKHWVTEHTLAPFWSAAMEEGARARYVARCVSSKSGPRRPLLPVSAVEWMVTRPVLCRVCDDENVSRLGFSYVDRSWLLPFLTRCPIHGERLAVFPQWTPASRGKAESIPAYPGRASAGRGLAEAGGRLLQLKEDLLPELGALLQTRGYTTRNGNLRRKAVAELLLAYSAGRYEHPALDKLLSSPQSVSRLLAPLWAARGCLHPFVGAALVSALRAQPVMEDALALVPDQGHDTRDGDAIAALRRGASLTAASRAGGVSVTTAAILALANGIAVNLRPKLLTHQRREKVEQLLATGMPVAEAASRAGLSASSVYRVLKSNPAIALAREQTIAQKRLAKARADWLAHIAAHPDWSVTALRRQLAAVYAFLYRADRKWLQANKPARVQHSGRGPRSCRAPLGADELLEFRVHSAAAQGEQGRRPLATKTRLAALAGRGRFRVDEKSTPKGTKALAQSAETVEEYVFRRLSQATAELRNLGVPLIPWRVVRQSRLRPTTIEASGVDVRDVIQATRAAALRRPRRA